MKKTFIPIKSLFLTLAIVFVLAGCDKETDSVAPANKVEAILGADAKTVDQAFDKEMQHVMNSIMKMMNQMELTCDPDMDFAHMMIMHHEMGVKMADIELKYGHEPRALELAEKTKIGNLASIARLEAFLASHPTPEPLSKEECKMFMMDMKEDMMAMMKCIKSVPDTSDPDVDFANLMICHHQGALDMSETELKWGDDEAALEEAKMIIEEQAQEIIELSAFVNEHGVPSKKKVKS